MYASNVGGKGGFEPMPNQHGFMNPRPGPRSEGLQSRRITRTVVAEHRLMAQFRKLEFEDSNCSIVCIANGKEYAGLQAVPKSFGILPFITLEVVGLNVIMPNVRKFYTL